MKDISVSLDSPKYGWSRSGHWRCAFCGVIEPEGQPVEDWEPTPIGRFACHRWCRTLRRQVAWSAGWT